MDFTLTDTNKHLLTSKIGTLTIKTKDYGDLRYIQVDKIYSNNLAITELINLPQILKSLYCWGNKITTLSNLPQTLKILDCNSNQITKLDNLPPSLKTLYCAGNQITSLDNPPQALKELYCGVNKITKLSNLPPNLIKISYSKNPIHALVERYDVIGKNITLAFLIQALELDSTIHTANDIQPIMDLIGNNYKMYTDIFIQSGINLKTHSSEEILNTLKHLT